MVEVSWGSYGERLGKPGSKARQAREALGTFEAKGPLETSGIYDFQCQEHVEAEAIWEVRGIIQGA